MNKLLAKLKDWFWTLILHRRIIKHLEGLLSKDLDVRIKELSVVEGDGLKAVIEHPFFVGTASVLADLLKRTGPKYGNFVVMDYYHEGEKISLTVQKAGAITPTDRITGLNLACQKFREVWDTLDEPNPLTPELALKLSKIKKEARELHDKWSIKDEVITNIIDPAISDSKSSTTHV
jgi:hypothetical protein